LLPREIGRELVVPGDSGTAVETRAMRRAPRRERVERKMTRRPEMILLVVRMADAAGALNCVFLIAITKKESFQDGSHQGDRQG
jgi:hypothetical protein